VSLLLKVEHISLWPEGKCIYIRQSSRAHGITITYVCVCVCGVGRSHSCDNGYLQTLSDAVNKSSFVYLYHPTQILWTVAVNHNTYIVIK